MIKLVKRRREKAIAAYLIERTGLNPALAADVVSGLIEMMSKPDTVTFPARMKDGRRVMIEYADKGDRIPCFDANGNRFEGYTSWLRIENGSDIYVQADRALALATAQPDSFRFDMELTALDSAGVDISSVPYVDNRKIEKEIEMNERLNMHLVAMTSALLQEHVDLPEKEATGMAHLIVRKILGTHFIYHEGMKVRANLVVHEEHEDQKQKG